MRNVRWFLGLAALGYVIYLLWGAYLSPEAKARAVVNRFMTAATAGDLATVESMVATGAKVPGSVWVAESKGLTYPGDPHVFRMIHQTPCGIEMVANLTLWSPEGLPSMHSLLLKRENGAWKVYQGTGTVC